MIASRHPTPDDVVIADRHDGFTIAQSTHPDQICCRTFEEAVERASAVAAIHHVEVCYEDHERHTTHVLDGGLIRRVWSEYLEQPGLCLTQAQAQRLWGLDRDTCGDILETLTSARVLVCGTDSRYRRVTADAVGMSRTRQARPVF